jgi:acyl-CoA reductase-like NAD-dependent aldehyde dehydrogenase
VDRSATSELRRLVDRARVAQPEWAARSLDERGRVLARAAKAMLKDKARIVELTKREMGKHEAEAMATEAIGHLEAVTAWRAIVAKAAHENVRLNPMAFPGKRATIDLVPRGVVGVIAPWNFPVAGLYRSVIPALLTGNAVILKPSEVTRLASAWFAEHLADFLPSGLVAVAQGDGAIGASLIDAGIDACVFTGSVESGAKVRAQCAARAIPCSVEMGGKDAAIVLPDCDLWRTVAGITHWSLSNSGQACGAIEIAYVDETIADEFVARMAEAWKKLRTGPGAPDVDVSPMATRAQLGIVAAHVAQAVKKGAKVVTGGAPTGDGLGFPPTLLDHCTSEMDVVANETFGPVLAVVRTRGVEDAIRGINNSRYGLGASVWTRDLARGRRIADRLDVGIVTLNNHAFTGAIPALPWTGTRSTGFGIANSHWSLTTFARPKVTVVDGQNGPEVFWMPFDKALHELFALLADAQAGRVLHAWRIPLLLRRRGAAVRRFFGG